MYYDAIAFCSRDNSMLTGKDAIASENLDITTVGIADRDIALRLVIEMATKLCQTGQYTDLRRNFTVQCLQCYAKFQGRAQCISHAQESGHNQFGEYKG